MRDNIIMWFIGFAIVVILVLCVWGGVNQQKWYDAHCVKFGEISGSTGFGPTFSGGNVGFGTVYIPGKTGYKCDDGLEHWE